MLSVISVLKKSVKKFSIDEITKEMHYFIDSLDFEDLLKAIYDLCEEQGIKITDIC